MAERKSDIDKLRSMVDSEKLRGIALDLLRDLEADAVRELGEALTDAADMISSAVDVVEEWTEATDREEKADARERALDVIELVCNFAEFDIGELTVPDWLKEELVRGPMEEA